MICKNCNKEHQSCSDLFYEIRRLREWQSDALVSLKDWHELGDILCECFQLRLGDNIPKQLIVQIKATLLVLKRMVNL